MTASIIVRTVLSRRAFAASTYRATLETAKGTPLSTTTPRATWSEAVRAALETADKRGITVTNRAAYERSAAERAARGQP